MSTEVSMGNEPFEGVKILDFTWMGVGPQSLSYLVFYGATAIKVDSFVRPDPMRFITPYKDGVAGLDRSYTFAYCHGMSEYDVTLNLSHPKGLGIARRLVAWADIVAESFTAGTMERLGLGYEDLKKIKPDIIMMRTCAHGQTGPMASHPSIGFQLTALSGLDVIAGWPDRSPCPLYHAFTDMVSPPFNAASLIAALDYKRRTGKGQCLDLSQHEQIMHCLAPLFLDYEVNQRLPRPNGNRLEYAAPHGIYRCQGEDRWCAVAVFSDKEWRGLCEVMGNVALADDPRFNTLLARKQNEDELDIILEEWTARYSAEEVMSLLQMAGIGAGLVANLGDIAEDPQLKHYHAFEYIDHPEFGKMSTIYQPPGFVLSEAPYKRGRPPLMGEHNYYVYTDILGIPDIEFAQLMQEGVFD
jgi:benzylsuccinate CoA-transferase BbsF subunit